MSSHGNHHQDSAESERRWAPRLWSGISFPGWVRLLVRNRCQIGWRYWYIAVADTFASLLNSFLHLIQELIYRRRVSQVEIRHAPLFIIGHWRTGTTLLHELLALDPRHTYPTTYACLAPNHFLLTERLLSRLLRFLLPARRPMDNMPMGWDRPQEDEFALCNLGLPSPYLTIAFPNRPPQYEEYFDLERVPPEARERWKRNFVYFLKQLTYRNPKRLVLKSPPHTFRIELLLELFPDARFVHLTRDPYEVFPSAQHLWKTLYRLHGFQRPTLNGLQEYVLDTFVRMHTKLQQTRRLVDPSRICELRFEDLKADPVGSLRRVYAHLELGDFEAVLPQVEQFLDEVKDHQPNEYELTEVQRAEIARRWVPLVDEDGDDRSMHDLLKKRARSMRSTLQQSAPDQAAF